jgi:hypothetical protein
MEGWKNWNLGSSASNNGSIKKNDLKLKKKIKLIRIQKQKQMGYNGEVVVMSLSLGIK